MERVAAVDLGASSVRVAAVDLDASPPAIDIVHRRAHEPVRDGASLRWDWPRIRDAVLAGLEAALLSGPVVSIGVDAWGVDYGLLDERGELLSPPFCYRDDRTANWRDLASHIGEEKLYAATGIQLMGINTIFQLAAHDRGELADARRLLMLPELMVHALTGNELAETTSAGTTQLVDIATGDWSAELLDAAGVRRDLFCDISRATTPAGTWRDIPVFLVGGHDTASAVAAVPGEGGTGFISSGTWMLVGAERPAADTSEAARAGNWSNEPGVLGGVRFLRNVMGLWMLEHCRNEWGNPAMDDLLAAADRTEPGPLVDATDERFLAPPSMAGEVVRAAGLREDAERAVIARCILDSLADAARRVIAELSDLTEEPVREIHVVGGGARNTVLNRLIEQACGIPVVAVATEATALGNALVQGIATGRFADLPEARKASTGVG